MQQELNFTSDKLKKAYLKLVNDIEFDQLELLNNEQTFFEIIGASKTEIRHSNFLAWLLNPDGSHGLGEAFLKRFIREIVADNRAIGVSEIEVEQLDFNNVKVLREWSNIDILIEFEELVFVIENKVLSKEHSNQLTRYREIAENEFASKKCVYGFLTPTGDDAMEENETYVAIGYDKVVSIIERIVIVKGNFIGANVKVYINDYLKTLKKRVMETDESVDLARSIYKNHKDLLDFIFEHKPDYKEPLKQIFLDEISNQGWMEGSSSKTYLRFLTKELKDVIPLYKDGSGWRGGESFVFELIFGSEKYVVFQAAVSPGIYSNSLKEILMGVEGAKEPGGKKWFAFFNTKMTVNYLKLSEMDGEELNAKVKAFIKKVEPIVIAVEKQIIKNKELIKAE